MMKKDWVYRRGDIYYADLNPVCGSEQGGKRPVVVIQNNIGNAHSPTLIVATITTKQDKRNYPTHYPIKENPAYLFFYDVFHNSISKAFKSQTKYQRSIHTYHILCCNLS